MKPLTEMAVEVLRTADAPAKAELSRKYAAEWREARAAGTPTHLGSVAPPSAPARPEAPKLVSPRDVPKRKPGTEAGRRALLHAVAHIELNAIDLHWDIVARFSDIEMPLGFYDDWVNAADDEAKHFTMLNNCLGSMDSRYGDLPAHSGMWQAATDTQSDIFARLAVVPMVLEARGLDVTPSMIEIFRSAGDMGSVSALETIYAEEVAHVAYGSKWFHFLCGRENKDPKPFFHTLVRKFFPSRLRPPFNEEKRAEAGIPPDFYWPLIEENA